MNVRPIGVVLAAATVALLTSCRAREESLAAEVPRLEIKAEVAKPATAAVVAPYDGRVATLLFPEGARVTAGAVVMTISNPTVERDLAYTRAQLALAEYRLRNAGRPPRTAPAPNANNDDRVRAAEEIVRSRKSRLDRYEGLFRTRDITADELENARMEYAAANRDLAAERNARRTVAEVAQPSDPALLQLDVDKARAELGVIEDRQQHLRVTAPIAGVITRILAKPGEMIFPRDPLFEVSDSSTLEVRGPIAPELVRHVQAGTPTEVQIFTVPPRRFNTTVRQVIPAADAAGATVVVSVSNPDGVLQPGTSATITLR